METGRETSIHIYSNTKRNQNRIAIDALETRFTIHPKHFSVDVTTNTKDTQFTRVCV